MHIPRAAGNFVNMVMHMSSRLGKRILYLCLVLHRHWPLFPQGPSPPLIFSPSSMAGQQQAPAPFSSAHFLTASQSPHLAAVGPQYTAQAPSCHSCTSATARTCCEPTCCSCTSATTCTNIPSTSQCCIWPEEAQRQVTRKR